MVTASIRADWAERMPAAIAELVRLPSVSPAFDPRWAANGHLEAVCDAATAMLVRELGSVVTVHRRSPAGRTPAVLAEIAGKAAGPAILVYGHLDVQPAGDGWRACEPFTPTRIGNRLYGRGAGDDKYVPAMVVSAVQHLVASGGSHPRILVLLETSEESSSVDLPAYLDDYLDLIGELEMVVCLDTFVPANDRLWLTSSLRGIVVADLTVAVAVTGLHSGVGGGVRPSSFRLLRRLLDRLENPATGELLVPALHSDFPDSVRDELSEQAALAGPITDSLGMLPTVRPMVCEPLDQLIAQTWRPAVAYAGIAGMPTVEDAGSVLRASTTMRLSIRLPPPVDAVTAAAALGDALTADPPEGAVVGCDIIAAQDGFTAARPARMTAPLDRASQAGWGEPAAWAAGGATIPFLSMISRRYPRVPVLPLGVLDPNSNAHGPDESLDLAAAARLTAALVELLRHD